MSAAETGLIGGGRWAHVLASVLERMGVAPVAVTSPGNPAAWQQRPAGWLQVDMAAIMADPGIRRVIIARRARDHADTVLAALASGKQVLVEKPFCLTRAQADLILRTARGRICQTGLVLLHASNQRRFCAACRAAGEVHEISLDWADPAGEHRYGATKTHDAGLNPVQDVMPHAWSLFRPLVDGPLRVKDAAPTADGTGARIELGGAARIELNITRKQSTRKRRLTVRGAGYSAVLDFSTEPGEARLNGSPVDVARGFSSPLEAELRAFLHGPREPLCDVSQAIEALDLTLDALALIRPRQAAAIRAGLRRNDDPGANAALREVALGGIAGSGTPAGLDELAHWLGLAPDDAALSRAWTQAISTARTAPIRRQDTRP